MQIFAAASLINGIVAVTFAILVISKNWRDRSNQIYFLMIMSMAVWAFSYWQWLLTTDSVVTAFLWVKLLSVGSLFLPILFFHWVILIIGKDKINVIILRIGYLASFLILLFINSHLFIASLQHKSIFPFWPDPGVVYDIYFCYLYIGLIAYTMYLLVRSYYLVSDVNKKGQLLYIILGATFAFGGGLSNFPLWWNIPFLPYGNLFVVAFPLFLGYSVFKYKLFNAKTIATEILVFFLVLITLIEAVLSQTVFEAFLKCGVFIGVSIYGYLIIRSVYREVAQREKIEKLAADLKNANDRLVQLDREKSEFVSFATHQLRSPLTAIKGYTSLILEGDLGALAKESKEAVSRIYESAQTLARIVDDYLNITRIELGSMKYSFDTIDLKNLIEDVIGELKPNIDKSKLALSFEAENNGTDYRVTADRDKLKQVIANVIDNSMKYTPQGSIKIRLSLDRKRHLFVITVIDTGVGIAPEVLPRLFKKWSRAENANKTNIRGTGLGLYVAKEIVEAHHGKIRAESAGEGKGATFVIELEPISKA